ncbi:MAG: trehalose-phosphatase [Acidobacteriota bacterium]|nr:trehalose-phosphatase [Acidobacteriota bacterium]
MNPPRPLFSDWPRLARRLRTTRSRVLLTDFDGTLVRIRRRPGDVRLSMEIRRLLLAIRDEGSVVGVVSGRGLEDLVSLVALPGIWYAGSHGYRLRDPRGRMISFATLAERRRIQRAIGWLRPRLGHITGVKLEVKHASVAVHYRTASPLAARRAEEAIGRVLEREPGLRLLCGKKVWELLPGDTIDKGTAVRRLLDEIHAPADRFVVYLGDDTTDESVFRKLRDGVTIVVGRRGNTAARYYLHSLADVREFLLRWLKITREAAGKGSRQLKSRHRRG